MCRLALLSLIIQHVPQHTQDLIYIQDEFYGADLRQDSSRCRNARSLQARHRGRVRRVDARLQGALNVILSRPRTHLLPLAEKGSLGTLNLLITRAIFPSLRSKNRKRRVKSIKHSFCRTDVAICIYCALPLVVIEAKRPVSSTKTTAMVDESISQHLRNQMGGGIQNLYAYSQVLLSISGVEGRYATTNTAKKFWSS